MGSHAPRVILFGAIPAIIPVIPEVSVVPADPIVAPKEGTVSVISPTGVLDLVDYSFSFYSDPSEDSLPPVPYLPLVSPSRSSSHDNLTPSFEYPLAPVFRRWRYAPLSTPYPPTTSESSLGSSFKRSLDSSTPSSGPSRKRCRSPAASVPSPTHDSRSIAPTLANLLPPRKRFIDSYSLEDSREEHMEVDTIDTEAVADVGLSDGVIAYTEDSVGMRVEIAASDVREDDEEFEAEAVEEALAAYEATCAANALNAENQSQNSNNDDIGNGRDGNGGDGNGENGNGRNGNLNENNKDARPGVRECTYQDFMKCQPLNFKGTKGVVRLIRWFEKMETMYHINNCPKKYQVKYATCTLLNSALTWWNSDKRTIGANTAFAMSWRELIKLIAEVYCPRTEIQKMESELWNLTMKNNDLDAYT
ncbi:reverse transcriptase domain-containing protein, partial [Tanacetum coccineum]